MSKPHLVKEKKGRNADGTFKKGEYTGGPGRPKGSVSIVEILKKKLEDIVDPKDKRAKAEFLAEKWLHEAMYGDDFKKLQEVVRYIDGMPTQKIVNENHDMNELVSNIEEKNKELHEELE